MSNIQFKLKKKKKRPNIKSYTLILEDDWLPFKQWDRKGSRYLMKRTSRKRSEPTAGDEHLGQLGIQQELGHCRAQLPPLVFVSERRQAAQPLQGSHQGLRSWRGVTGETLARFQAHGQNRWEKWNHLHHWHQPTPQTPPQTEPRRTIRSQFKHLDLVLIKTWQCYSVRSFWILFATSKTNFTLL